MLTIEEVIEIKESIEEAIEGIEKIGDGNVLVRVPHLIVHMTPPDRVEILGWRVQEGDIVQPDAPMLQVDFLQDDWYLPVPSLGGPLRVVSIKALVGSIVHLHDPLIILAPVQTAA